MGLKLPEDLLKNKISRVRKHPMTGKIVVNIESYEVKSINSSISPNPQWDRSSQTYSFYFDTSKAPNIRYTMYFNEGVNNCEGVKWEKDSSTSRIKIFKESYVSDESLKKSMPEFKDANPTGDIIEFINKELKKYNINCLFDSDTPSTPNPEGGQGEGQTDNSSCSNTGQFGGGGTPLKDIKLFLYANKVTKGTVTLSKPQVEVGTYATDWRPNPADATKRIEMMLKQIESVRKGGRKNGKKRN